MTAATGDRVHPSWGSNHINNDKRASDRRAQHNDSTVSIDLPPSTVIYDLLIPIGTSRTVDELIQ
jgi:hypothetical protein